MNSSQQGNKFNNSLQKYIDSVKHVLPSLQEPFKVARNASGVKRVIPSNKKECKAFAEKYGTQEETGESQINTPFGKCIYKSKTNSTWDPKDKSPLPDGFFFIEEQFKVARNASGVKRVIPSNKKECKAFAEKYGTQEETGESQINTPFGKCIYKSKTNSTWDPKDKSPLPDGFFFIEESENNNISSSKKNNNQFHKLNKRFNKDLLKYTGAFNEYNEQLIQHNYATPGSTATLLSMNNELVKTAEQIHDSVDIMNIMDSKLKKALKEKKKQLHKSILELKEQQKKLEKMKYNNITLDASFNDNQRLSNSINLKYLLFLIGTIILLVTLYKLNRSL